MHDWDSRLRTIQSLYKRDQPASAQRCIHSIAAGMIRFFPYSTSWYGSGGLIMTQQNITVARTCLQNDERMLFSQGQSSLVTLFITLYKFVFHPEDQPCPRIWKFGYKKWIQSPGAVLSLEYCFAQFEAGLQRYTQPSPTPRRTRNTLR